MLNKDSFSSLFSDYYQALSNFAMKFVDDPDLAEDLVQEAFVTLWNKRDSIDIKISIKNYLFTMVKNNALAWLRRQNLEQNIVQATFLEEMDDESMKHELDVLQFQVQVKKAIEKLPKKCRQVFVLCKLEGLTREEAANYLNVSVKAVEKQISKAYRILRPLLKDFKF